MNAINPDQAKQMTEGKGFIAALDQSGGSTPKALGLYGVTEDQWTNEDEMFDLVHEMRTRIIKSPSFNSDHIIGAILFEQTMDREIDGIPTAQYLWEKKGIVPFLKTDKGLADKANGVQLMKPCPGLDELLERGVAKGIFGTNEGSAIGVVNGVRELGAKGVTIVGYDSGKAQTDAIREGLMAGAITQNPIGIGYETVKAAVAAAKGEAVPAQIDTGFYWYDKTNIDSPEIAAVLYD